MSTIQKIWIYLLLITVHFACSPSEPSPTEFIGTWKPITVLLNNSRIDYAASGQPYQNFQLTLNGNDRGGTYSLNGVPIPFDEANSSGNWSKSNAIIQLQNVPNGNGFSLISNVQIINNELKFQVILNDSKTGIIVLNFTMFK